MDYKSVVTAIGALVPEFAAQGMIIVYDDNAPPELAEMSVLHTACPVDRDVRAGDVVILGDRDYVVTAVGEEALHTLRKMGHCCFLFGGADKVELPGQIMLAGDGVPNIKIGDHFEIMFT